MRYALFFSPSATDSLTETASRWLGRNAFSGEGFDDYASFADVTEEPRRYGFHATLKAPFELAEGRHESELVEAFSAFAASHAAFDIPEIVIGSLGPFFALVPATLHQPLQDFTADVVRHFEPFRAPLSERDIARRKPETLSESQRANLHRWGYPYVMDDFRFHMTLTGPVSEARRQEMGDILSKTFSGFIHSPLTISGLGLFVEKERGEAFTVHSWQPLAASNTKDVRNG
ncbi:DUF1045 domain-containing protein [Agrobacterium sp. 22094]|uniref:DUF1045 domain-containing protein n=1 Tax=Agrobacterium sp. 22094 TaxID=3453872 RepID=UPI003F837879